MINMKNKIIFSMALMLISLNVVAFAQFSSITVTPTGYSIDMTGGDTRIVDATLKNTNDEAMDVDTLTDISYTGNCAGRGEFDEDLDMQVSYCDADGSNCDPGKIYEVPAFGTLPIKIKHDANIAACPGTYTINNTIEFIEQELPMIQAFGYFHDGISRYRIPRGSMKIFRKLNTNELRLELNDIYNGLRSRRCTITSDKMTFVSRRIICKSQEAGQLQIYIVPAFNYISVGFGNKIMFRGVLI